MRIQRRVEKVINIIKTICKLMKKDFAAKKMSE